MSRGDFYIGPTVANAHKPPVHGGKQGTEGRTDDAGNTAQTYQGAGYQGSGGAGGYHAGNIVPVPEQDDGFHHGGVPLEAHDVRGFFLTANHFRSMDNFQAVFVEGFSFQLLLQEELVAGEHYMQVREGAQRSQGAFYRSLRAVVAAKTVYQEFNHRLFTYAR